MVWSRGAAVTPLLRSRCGAFRLKPDEAAHAFSVHSSGAEWACDARLFLCYMRSRQRYFCHGIARRKCNLPLRAGTEIHGLKPIEPERRRRKTRDATMRVGAGGVELVKRGASRYDFRDPIISRSN
jgi:hypothetical protein